MAPATPGRPTGGEDIDVGDAVEVPGNLHGIVRFVGSVQGKKGTFAGVELNADFAAKGKNNGDVDGYVKSNALGFCIQLTLLQRLLLYHERPWRGLVYPYFQSHEARLWLVPDDAKHLRPQERFPKLDELYSSDPGSAQVQPVYWTWRKGS